MARGSSKGVTIAVTGDMALNRKLSALGNPTTVKRIAARGLSAGMQPVQKALRAAINATDASPYMKREARKTIGKTVSRKGPQPTAKAGFSVGKKTKQVQRAKSARTKRLGKGKGGGKGVGVSAANIHWFVLGTEERELKEGKRAGQPTGKITPPFADVMRQAVAASQAPALGAARAKITQEILKEASKVS